VLHGMAENIARHESPKVSFAAIIFLLFIDFCLALLNLLPSVIARSMIPGGQMGGSGAITATCVHYATFFLLIRIPYMLIMGRLHMGYLTEIGSVVSYAAWAAMSYVAAYHVVTIPPFMNSSPDEMLIPLTDSDKCAASLGDFMTLLAQALGERRKMEKLWNPVYTYLKELPKIQNLVHGKGLKHDQIALNAVGNIAFKMLASGELHAAYGVLSPDGEYVRKVWWVTANELVRRSYNGSDDVTQGLAALDAAIVSAGPMQ